MKLDRYLFEHMMTQKEFAALLGCSRNYVSMVCCERTTVSRKMAKLIEQVTNGAVVYKCVFRRKRKKKELAEQT